MKICIWLLPFLSLFLFHPVPCMAGLLTIDTVKIDGNVDSIWTFSDQQLWVFCDTTHQLTYEDVQQLKLDAFKPTKNGKFGLDRMHTNHYWFKFELRNNHLTQEIDLALNIDRIDLGTLYQKTGAKKSTVSYSQKKHTYKDGYYTYYSIPITLPANQTSSFLFNNKTNLRTFDNFQCLIISKNKFQKAKLKNMSRHLTFNAFQGIFFGFLAFAILFSLFQFMAQRDTAYFYYTAYLLCIFFYYLSGVPYLKLVLTFSNYFPLGNPFVKTLTFIIVSIYLLFLRAFLDINEKSNKQLSTIMSLLQVGLLLLIVIDFVYRYSEYWMAYSELHDDIRFVLLAIGFCLIVPIFVLSRKERFSIYIVMGTLFLLISGLLNNLYVNGKEHFIRDYMTLTQIGILGEIFFFSLGLSLRSRHQLTQARANELETNQLLHQEKLTKIQIQKDQALFQKQLAVTELKALRAQINPHFISNALNGIKLMVQKKQEEKAADYLADFSSLIRTILINSDEQFISLQRELDYCKLYLKIEALRFDKGFTYQIKVEENIDTTYVKIPPLLLQPYIENAIWHGLLPKEGLRHLDITIKNIGENIYCIVDDNGIGRKKVIAQKNPRLVAKKSYGLAITNDRIKINNDLFETGLAVEIIDKKDKSGKVTGTRVELIIPL